MKRIILSATLVMFAAPSLAEKAEVDITLTALEYSQSITKTKPDEGDDGTTKETTAKTTPWDLEVAISKDSYVMYLSPDVGDEGGSFALGYRLNPTMEFGLGLLLDQSKIKDDDGTDETEQTSNLMGFGPYARFLMPLADKLTLRFEPTVVILKGETKFDDGEDELKNSLSGTGLGLNVTLIHQCADNLYWEGTLGYSLSNLKTKDEDSDGDQESKLSTSTLTITPIALRLNI